MNKKLKTMTPKPAETLQPKPAVEREFTPIQELATDLFGDMLLNGARKEETEYLLTALLMHQWHRDFGDYQRDPAKALEHAHDFARKSYDQTYVNLVAAWPKKPAAINETPAKTVAEKVRHSVRDEVRTQFGDFMGSASPEELYLMRDIFRDRGGDGCIADGSAVQEIPLARAIEGTIGSWGTTHIKIQEKMVPLIEQLVAARQQIEEAEECA